MSANIDPIYVRQVIGDIVDTITPCINMKVYIDGRQIINGCTIKPSIAIVPPQIRFEGQAERLYTLLLTDPDMPSPSNPTLREYIHWIVTDIPGSGAINQGNEILPYEPPTPIRGYHRYILMMFEQMTPLGLLSPPLTRAHFDHKTFVWRHQLGVPKAIAYFWAKKEPGQGRQDP
ncbi:protein MOTHER of FT and TFL1-like [Apium graveolens]|uniref:protein MOTHER of FT and TFL1-like n=1 Tax=Apium graveolens TaxID=4045 RepID=UPI003D78F071